MILQKMLHLRRTRENLFRGYQKQLEGLKKAEEKTAELIKAITPEADREELFYKAMEIVSLYEGQEMNVYRKTLQRELHPETVVLLTPMEMMKGAGR